MEEKEGREAAVEFEEEEVEVVRWLLAAAVAGCFSMIYSSLITQPLALPLSCCLRLFGMTVRKDDTVAHSDSVKEENFELMTFKALSVVAN